MGQMVKEWGGTRFFSLMYILLHTIVFSEHLLVKLRALFQHTFTLSIENTTITKSVMSAKMAAFIKSCDQSPHQLILCIILVTFLCGILKLIL